MPRHSPAIRSAADDDATPPRAKRPRAAQACDRCRLKKYKCDESYPCSHCKKSQLDCVYQGNYRQREDNRSANYVVDLEKKVNELTAKLHDAESKLSHPESLPPNPNVTPCSMAPEPRATPRPQPQPQQGEVEEVATEQQRDTHAGQPPHSEPGDEPGDGDQDEITELNHHTNGIEFHGSTSSVAFLGHLQKARDPTGTEEQWHAASARSHTRGVGGVPGFSIVSTLHNSSFSPAGSAAQSLAAVHEHNYYFEQAHIFMSGYFDNIHFIHPLIDKEDFYLRAHDLWLHRAQSPDPNFVALYLSVLSFGALVRVWDEVQLGGLTRFEWSRKLFGEAQLYLNYLQFSNNLDTVQCLYLMAKICQNELNPNRRSASCLKYILQLLIVTVAYMYLGLAVRTCLAAGFNREVRNSTDPRAEWISKTWWGLFSLEIEMSFSVGRPDTLGMDEYHNRPLPPRDDSEYAIIPWMVDFAQIIRKVSVQIYHSRIALQEKLHVALQVEAELDRWMARLPDRIKPEILHRASGNPLRDPKWARRQRLVLGIRYYNVKMLLFRPFLNHFTRQLRHPPAELAETIAKCLDAAEKTIEVIHDIYRVHTFFRCWWYNATYVIFATSTLLLPMSKLGVCPETLHLQRSVEKAVEVLEAMDESVVAHKSVEIIKHYLREFLRVSSSCTTGNNSGGGLLPDNANGVVDDALSGHQVVDNISIATAGLAAQQTPGFDIPEWAYGFGFPDCSFEGIARLFDDLGGLPMLDAEFAKYIRNSLNPRLKIRIFRSRFSYRQETLSRDRFKSVLAEHNITHILSVTRLEDVPFSPDSAEYHVKPVDVDDDATEDLLAHLDEICDWVEKALRRDSEGKPSAVLVHCSQGVSRSGSVIVAYLMRSLSLPYHGALSLAREGRTLIDPNVGFKYQLQIWERCCCSVFTQGDRSGRVPKPEYQVWKKEIEGIYSRDLDAIPQARADWMEKLAVKVRSLHV